MHENDYTEHSDEIPAHSCDGIRYTRSMQMFHRLSGLLAKMATALKTDKMVLHKHFVSWRLFVF